MDLPRSGHNLKITAIANQKGGIVKATSAVNIDVGLTRSKKLCLQNQSDSPGSGEEDRRSLSGSNGSNLSKRSLLCLQSNGGKQKWDTDSQTNRRRY